MSRWQSEIASPLLVSATSPLDVGYYAWLDNERGEPCRVVSDDRMNGCTGPTEQSFPDYNLLRMSDRPDLSCTRIAFVFLGSCLSQSGIDGGSTLSILLYRSH